MAEKVYSTTVLGAKPTRGRPAQGSAEVEGNVEYKESKSKTPRSKEEQKALNTIQIGTVGAATAGALFSAGSEAKEDYRASRVLQRNRAGRRQYKIQRPDNL
jgi:hypothetical protein